MMKTCKPSSTQPNVYAKKGEDDMGWHLLGAKLQQKYLK